jgi:GT2 family glycosyltransferase
MEKLLFGLFSIQSDEGIVVHFLENSDQDSLRLLKKYKELINFEYTHDKERKNLGFGKGHNFLFNKYKEEYGESFMLLNHDTLPFYDFLVNAQRFKKFIKDDWGILECSQFPKPHPKDYDGETFETEWCSAAASIYRTKAFEQIGGFDETFFMYCEDVDLSWRLREKGYKLYFCPIAKIGHITRELDEKKDPAFEEIQFYMKQIKDHPNYKEIARQYDSMIRITDENKMKEFRKYRKPKLYPDTNYAFHRW